MVVGYDCPNCGFKHECDVGQSGERICPDCEIAVTGITTRDMGHGRSDGQDEFIVTLGWQTGETVRVTAHDYPSAYDAAKPRVGEDDCITDITRVERV